MALRLNEEVPYPGRAYAHEHFYEIAAAYYEERHAGFAGYGFCEERLSRSGGAYEQDAFRDPASELREFLGALQEFDYLLNLFLRLIDAGYVLEGYLVLVLRKHPGLVFTERHRFSPARLELPHEYDHYYDQKHQRRPVEQHVREGPFLVGAELEGYSLFFKLCYKIVVRRPHGFKTFHGLVSDRVRVLTLDLLALEFQVLDLSLFNVRKEIAVRYLLDITPGGMYQLVEGDDGDEYD